ncbi:hypothetical protein ABTK02_21060, partial [Acinetobacter baumannii]
NSSRRVEAGVGQAPVPAFAAALVHAKAASLLPSVNHARNYPQIAQECREMSRFRAMLLPTS